MTLPQLLALATDKKNFDSLQVYLNFTRHFLEFCADGLQATIVAKNEPRYQFFQFREDGHFNVTRPLNSDLMFDANEADALTKLVSLTQNARSSEVTPDDAELFRRAIYTVQQSIGATLDALPANRSNTARKINGDLFERLIQMLLREAGVDCTTGTVKVPVIVDGIEQFKMSYQHDLLLTSDGELKLIGSVKTSSKDRINKIFLDKFLYSKLTGTALPHIAIFLNDVQRKATKDERKYNINSTFLTGHFKGFIVKLNPLDGVYYCDIRPAMQADKLLAQHISTIDQLFFHDVWTLLQSEGDDLDELIVDPETV